MAQINRDVMFWLLKCSSAPVCGAAAADRLFTNLRENPRRTVKQRDPAEQGHGTTAAAAKNISCKLKYTEHT